MRLKSVIDGKQVNIPVLLQAAMEGRRRLNRLSVGDTKLKAVEGRARKRTALHNLES